MPSLQNARNCLIRYTYLTLTLSRTAVVAQDNDPVGFSAAPLYLSADSCVQSVVAYQWGYNMELDCGEGNVPASCLCGTSNSLSFSVANSISVAASVSCNGGSDVSTALGAFSQYCAMNKQAASGGTSATAQPGQSRSTRRNLCVLLH